MKLKKTIVINTESDSDVEGNETFKVTLYNPKNNAVLGTQDETVVIILNDDQEVEQPQSTISMNTSAASVNEGSGITVYVDRDGDLSGTDTVSYTIVSDTADTTDYVEHSGTITFTPNDDQEAIDIQTIDNDLYEGEKTFKVQLSNPTGYASIGTYDTTYVTIIDDESSIEFASDALMVEEGNEVELTVVRAGNSAGTDTVDYLVTFGTTGSADHEVKTGTVSFAPGETSQTIQVQTTEDTIYEPAETFNVTLSNTSGNAVLGTSTSAEVTIYDDDMPTVQFELSELSINEGESADVTVTLSAVYDHTITVSYTLTHGSSNSGDVAPLSGTLTFAPGETEKTITITTIEDTAVEGNETFAVQITAESNEYIGSIPAIAITILNDDIAESNNDNDDDEPATGTGGTGGGSGGGSSQSEEDTSSQRDVENLASAITDALDTDNAPISTNVADVFFDVMEKNIEEIENEVLLTDALTSYIDTIEAVAEIGTVEITEGTTVEEQQEWMEAQIIEISSVVTEAVQKIEDDASLIEIATAVMDQIQAIEEVTEAAQTTEVKNQIAELAQSVLTKVSEIEVEPTIEVVDGVSEVTFDQTAIAETIAQKAKTFQELADSFNEFYGDENVREFEFEITLVTERVADQVQVPIAKETIDTLSEAGVDSLSVAVGGTTVTLDKEVFAAGTENEEGVVEAPDLVVDMNFNDQGFEVRDENMNFKKGIVTDVRVFQDDAEKKTLEKPVELKFNLGDFEFWEEDYNPSSLSIYRLDEETGEWNPVGGKYDPVTNTVRTNRLTLSQYTVMQSNKSFADVETSWAKDEINELLGKGIIDETASFNPEEAITREEFTTWVARAYGVVDDTADAPFTDIPEDHEHYEELASAYNAGIISGGGDGSFNPGDAITKEQMSTILANAMIEYDDMKHNEGLTGTLASASDADLISDWASDDIAMLVELGVIDNSSGEINPQQQLSKEEAASILKKIYG